MFLDQLVNWDSYEPFAKECFIPSLNSKVKLYPIGVLSSILRDAGQPRQVDTIRKLEAKGYLPRATYRFNEKRRYDKFQIEALVTSFIESESAGNKKRKNRFGRKGYRQKLKEISFLRFVEAREKLKKEIEKNAVEEKQEK